VSRTIFAVWDCVPYKAGPDSETNFLRRDESVECQTGQHTRMIFIAIALVILWPIGMQLLFFLTLYVNRKTLRSGVQNSISKSTRFLTGGYKNEYFYWETIELFRRLTCSGFVILVPQQFIFMRIIMALMVSLPILVLTAALQPFRNKEDNALALVSQTILILAYGACAIVWIVNSGISNDEKLTLLGFTSAGGPFMVLTLCCLVYLILLIAAYGYKINEEYMKRVRMKGDKESQESSTWILATAGFLGITALVGGGVIYGMVGGIIGSTIFFPAGGALGSVLYARCNEKVKRLSEVGSPVGSFGENHKSEKESAAASTGRQSPDSEGETTKVSDSFTKSKDRLTRMMTESFSKRLDNLASYKRHSVFDADGDAPPEDVYQVKASWRQKRVTTGSFSTLPM